MAKLRSLKPTHHVEFFDSSTMRNRTEPGRLLHASVSDDPDVEDMATVEVDQPIRKRVRVPLACCTPIS